MALNLSRLFKYFSFSHRSTDKSDTNAVNTFLTYLMRHRFHRVLRARKSVLRRCSFVTPSLKLQHIPFERQLSRPPTGTHPSFVRAFSTAMTDELKSLQLEHNEKVLAYPAVSNGASADASGSLATTTSTANVQASFTAVNPVDVYRAHISKELASLTGLDAIEIYPRLQWTQTLDKGDLVLPVPALRIKGKKPNELAAELAEKA